MNYPYEMTAKLKNCKNFSIFAPLYENMFEKLICISFVTLAVPKKSKLYLLRFIFRLYLNMKRKSSTQRVRFFTFTWQLHDGQLWNIFTLKNLYLQVIANFP